jgi:hypothetical protein
VAEHQTVEERDEQRGLRRRVGRARRREGVLGHPVVVVAGRTQHVLQFRPPPRL